MVSVSIILNIILNKNNHLIYVNYQNLSLENKYKMNAKKLQNLSFNKFTFITKCRFNFITMKLLIVILFDYLSSTLSLSN